MTYVDSSTNTTEINDINRRFEEQDVQKKAQTLGIPYVDIAHYPLNADMIKLVEPQQAKEGQILCFDRVKHVLKIAVVDPNHPKVESFLSELQAKQKEYKLFLCSPSGFQHAFRVYDAEFFQKKTIDLREDVNENTKASEFSKEELARIQEELTRLTSSEVLNEIKLLAIQYKASDIHLQPNEDQMVVRFRIDGILHDVFHFSLDDAQGLVTRIKYEAGMKANITDSPQDGHSTVTANGREVDLRVSSLPTQTIESIVIRVLDSNKGLMSFEELGASPENTKKINQMLQKKTGMILVTGPTGSGKTTTLYSMLAQLNTDDRKLVTLEDPIEYHLEGITQSEVNENSNYNFETGLKALVRHDPDVILVGEIRSHHTAKLAIEASMTGHVVLSSLHTNSALGAIDRLRNIGLEDYNIAPGINALFAQRLVRRVCPDCAKKSSLPNNQKQINASNARLEKLGIKTQNNVVEAVGCKECAGIGYLGQIAITETVLIDDTLRQMILDGKSTLEMKEYVLEQTDFLSLFDDGLRKVMDGQTTLEELYRVVG